MILHFQEALAAECKCPTPVESDAAKDTTGDKSNKESSKKEEEKEELKEVDPDQYCRYVTKIRNSLVIFVELKYLNLLLFILLMFSILFSLIPSPYLILSLFKSISTYRRYKMCWLGISSLTSTTQPAFFTISCRSIETVKLCHGCELPKNS